MDIIPFHEHNGLDAPQISGRNLRGFPILTAEPTHEAPEGTILLALISGTYYFYARINKNWKRTPLT